MTAIIFKTIKHVFLCVKVIVVHNVDNYNHYHKTRMNTVDLSGGTFKSQKKSV